MPDWRLFRTGPKNLFAFDHPEAGDNFISVHPVCGTYNVAQPFPQIGSKRVRSPKIRIAGESRYDKTKRVLRIDGSAGNVIDLRKLSDCPCAWIPSLLSTYCGSLYCCRAMNRLYIVVILQKLYWSQWHHFIGRFDRGIPLILTGCQQGSIQTI